MKPITNHLTTLFTAVGLMSFSATADDQSSLKQWAHEAGSEISSVMRYPMLAERQGHQGTTAYIVTINRDGDVLNFSNAGKRNKVIFNSASKRALKRVDFPALPDSYDGEQLRFKLTMEYRENVDPTRQAYLNNKNRRKGKVTGTRIAFLPADFPVAAE